MKRKSFVFYDGFYNAIKKMRTAEEKAELIEAICKYEFEGEIPEMSYVCEVAFEVIKPNLDAAAARYDASVENGKKGGRPKKDKNLEEPTITYNNLEEPTRNHNDNENVNENENENANAKLEQVDSNSEQDILFEKNTSFIVKPKFPWETVSTVNRTIY